MNLKIKKTMLSFDGAGVVIFLTALIANNINQFGCLQWPDKSSRKKSQKGFHLDVICGSQELNFDPIKELYESEVKMSGLIKIPAEDSLSLYTDHSQTILHLSKRLSLEFSSLIDFYSLLKRFYPLPQ